MSEKHTPGPWEAGADAHGRGRIYGGGVWLAPTWLPTGDGNNAPKLPAIDNARLIAAAPELLEALEAAVRQTPKRYTNERSQYGDRVASHPEWVAQALAAIAKATGQEGGAA